jgi:protein ImuB
MARWLCAHLPYFRTERNQRASPAPHEALAIVREVSRTARVVAANPLALARGIEPGMTLTEARALLPTLAATPVNDAAETRELESLASCAVQLSPRVFLAPPQTLLADVTGCDRALGGEAEMLKLARGIFERQGYTVHCAICDSATAAYALALDGGRANPVEVGKTQDALKGLPLETLRLDQRSLVNLRALGLSRAGQLLELPSATLPSRFDETLVQRVRQLRGELPEDFPAFTIPEAVSERLEFEGPTDRRDAMMFALRHIATRIADRLDALGTGASKLEAALVAADGAPMNFSVDVSAPTRDSSSIATLLLGRFNTLDTKDRWFEAIEVSVPQRLPVNSRQQDLFGAARDVFSPGLRGLIDELVGRLGVAAVARPVLQQDPRPENAVAWVPFLERTTQSAAAPMIAPAVIWPSQEMDVDEDEQGLPAIWHEGRRRHNLRVIRGPQRVEFGWWEGERGPPSTGSGQAQDFFEIEDALGARLFVFKQGKRWYSCGAW